MRTPPPPPPPSSACVYSCMYVGMALSCCMSGCVYAPNTSTTIVLCTCSCPDCNCCASCSRRHAPIRAPQAARVAPRMYPPHTRTRHHPAGAERSGEGSRRELDLGPEHGGNWLSVELPLQGGGSVACLHCMGVLSSASLLESA